MPTAAQLHSCTCPTKSLIWFEGGGKGEERHRCRGESSRKGEGQKEKKNACMVFCVCECGLVCVSVQALVCARVCVRVHAVRCGAHGRGEGLTGPSMSPRCARRRVRNAGLPEIKKGLLRTLAPPRGAIQLDSTVSTYLVVRPSFRRSRPARGGETPISPSSHAYSTALEARPLVQGCQGRREIMFQIPTCLISSAGFVLSSCFDLDMCGLLGGCLSK